MATSYFLLLAQKKVTKENGTLGSAPSATPRVRYGRTGFAHRASCPVVEIGAIPRAARVRGTRLVRPPFAASQRDPRAKASFCGRDCRALALPGPLSAAASARRKSREAGARRMRARSTRAQGCAPGEPRSLLAQSRGQGCPRDRGREGAFFFGYFLLGKQKKVTGGHGWPTKHTRT